MKEKQTRARYTLEFKLEAVRLVNDGQSVGVTAKVLGYPRRRWATGFVRQPRGRCKALGTRS
jgi:transposase-like protein